MINPPQLCAREVIECREKIVVVIAIAVVVVVAIAVVVVAITKQLYFQMINMKKKIKLKN